MGPILFYIVINDLDGGAERTFSKIADDTKLRESIKMLEGHAAIQEILDRLEKRDDINFIKFNKEKCEDLCLGRNKILGTSA